jgi:cyclic pyranopterin phosphate synthase
MESNRLTHLDGEGRAHMVDVSAKPVTWRRAVAEGRIRMKRETLDAIRTGDVAKGDVLAVARLAAIGGAKRTAETIPLCHPLALTSIEVEIEVEEGAPGPGLRLTVEATVEARTGVEMEALCGVSAGLLAVYDMCKALDRAMEIDEVRLVAKEGGRSGPWRRPDTDETREIDR